jgi:hypothetical protein
MLISWELMDVLIIREQRHLGNSWPSRFPLFTIAGYLASVFLISILGMPGVVPINPPAALTVVAFSLFFAFAINDPIKVRSIKKFWANPCPSSHRPLLPQVRFLIPRFLFPVFSFSLQNPLKSKSLYFSVSWQISCLRIWQKNWPTAFVADP